MGMMESVMPWDCPVPNGASLQRPSNVRLLSRSYLAATSILTGSLSDARCSLATLLVIVAENRNVRRTVGMTLRILLISSSKSMCKRRSASSMTWEKVAHARRVV